MSSRHSHSRGAAQTFYTWNRPPCQFSSKVPDQMNTKILCFFFHFHFFIIIQIIMIISTFWYVLDYLKETVTFAENITSFQHTHSNYFLRCNIAGKSLLQINILKSKFLCRMLFSRIYEKTRDLVRIFQHIV